MKYEDIMFKVEVKVGSFEVSVETSSISDENMIRKLIDDITKKYTTTYTMGKVDFNQIQLSDK